MDFFKKNTESKDGLIIKILDIQSEDMISIPQKTDSQKFSWASLFSPWNTCTYKYTYNSHKINTYLIKI